MRKEAKWEVSDEMMGLFALYASHAKEEYARYGCYALARQAEKISDEIFNILEKSGYYEK